MEYVDKSQTLLERRKIQQNTVTPICFASVQKRLCTDMQKIIKSQDHVFYIREHLLTHGHINEKSTQSMPTNVYCVNSVKGIVRYFKKFEILQKLQSIVKVPILTVSSRYLCGHTKEYKSVSAARFGLPPKPSDMPTLP